MLSSTTQYSGAPIKARVKSPQIRIPTAAFLNGLAGRPFLKGFLYFLQQ